jgi:UDP-N-acetylmuramoylalanine--D-glutamate ligase
MTKLKSYLDEIKNKNIHILGVSGAEGAEIALFLHKNGLPNVTLHDTSDSLESFTNSFNKSHSKQNPEQANIKLEKITNLPYELNLKENYLKNINKAELIFVPQSWFMYKENQVINNLSPKPEISSIAKLYLQLAPCKVVGITGSNGKSTTTFLTHKLLSQSQNSKVYLTGNDRQASQILDIFEQIQPKDLIITEISNRQLLETHPYSPDIAILTNITENHLTEHKDFHEYADVKAKITKFQNSDQHFIYTPNDEMSRYVAQNTQAKLHTFGNQNASNPNLTTLNCYFDDYQIYYNSEPIISLADLPLKGNHNFMNVCAAITAAKLFNISNDQIVTALKSFTGLPQRVEHIFSINGIDFYDDRQGTSLDATIQAINTLSNKPTTLILGGLNKAKNIQPLVDLLQTKKIQSIGIKSPFVTELQASNCPGLTIVNTLTEALEAAKLNTSPGSNILFSPACEYGPYFNPLPGYEDAENFNQLSKQIFSA